MWPLKLRLLALAGVLLALNVALPPRNDLGGPEVYRQTLRATVLIVTPARSKGTGWVLDRNKRLVVTNYHVVGDQDTVDVIFPVYHQEEVIAARSHYVENRRSLEEAGRLVRGRVLHKEKSCDLALIELASLPDDARELRLAADSPRPGTMVHSIGNRGDLDVLWTYTSGTVRQVFRTRDGYFWRGEHLSKDATVIVTQSPINDGDSGGPLVNERGEVVGVLAAVQWQAHLASVGIDVTELRAFLARAKQEVPRSAPEKSDDQPAGKDLYSRLLGSVAWVKSSTSSNRATGWLLDRDRKLLLASYHVVGKQDAVDVIFPVFQNGRVVAEHRFYRDNERLLRQRGHWVRGRVLTRDSRRNLALLELDSLPEAVAEMELAERSPRPGERVHTLGNPNGIEALWLYTSGTVRQHSFAGLGHTEEKPDPAVLLVQFPGSSNDSSGPVVNDEGRLVGMITGKESPQQLVGYCLDAGEIRAFLYEARPRWDPRTAADHQQRGAFHTRTGQYDRAITAYTTALKLDPASAILLSERAYVHVRKGDADQAIADCNEAIKLDARLPSAYYHRAAAYNHKNDPNRALADCTLALKLDPKSAAAFAQRGNAHRLKGDVERAVADCDEAIWLDHRLAAAYCFRGLVLTAKGEPDKALPDLSRAIELDPYAALAHRARGDVHRLKNETDKAMADYTQAIELDQRDVLAYHGRGLTLALRDRHDSAIADFNRALQIVRFARAQVSRGTCWMRKGDFERAVSDYTQAMRLQASLTGEVLRDVQQRAAELGAGERADVERCCELCRRVLRMFEQRAEVQKLIKDRLAAAEKETDVRERAQILRAAIRDLRDTLGSSP